MNLNINYYCYCFKVNVYYPLTMLLLSLSMLLLFLLMLFLSLLMLLLPPSMLLCPLPILLPLPPTFTFTFYNLRSTDINSTRTRQKRFFTMFVLEMQLEMILLQGEWRTKKNLISVRIIVHSISVIQKVEIEIYCELCQQTD